MKPILFVDRDGALIEEPGDRPGDAYETLRFVADVVPALLTIRDAGYELVMVTSQDGLGTPSFRRDQFDGPHRLMLQLFESQGIRFRELLADEISATDGPAARGPGVGQWLHLVRDRDVDWTRSAVVGDREADMELARELGVRGFQLRTAAFGGEWDWGAISHELARTPRTATIERVTRETAVRVTVDLDRPATPDVSTGLGFFDHMLEQLGNHGGFALTLRAEGDLRVDEHHTVEDTALALGAALRDALGAKRGIARYGFTLPMDESLASAAIDLSGRACFVFEGSFRRERVGGLPTELVPHFFRSLCDAAGMTMHLRVAGDNDHHQIEACFKVVARAMREAFRREGGAVPSTKGVL